MQNSLNKRSFKMTDVQALNIVLQVLSPDVYSLVNHCQAAKDIWDRVKLLMQGTELSYQERECKLYNEFDKFTLIKGLGVLVFLPGDDPIACLNKAMAFMSTVMASSFPSTNHQLRTSSNLRNQATIQDGRVTVQQGTWQSSAPTLRGQEEGQVLDEEQLEFLADLGIPDGQAIQITILQNAAFQTDDLDAYDSDCDDISSEKRFLWLIFLVTVQTSSSRYHNMTLIIYNDMINQSVQETQNFEQYLIDYVPDNEITSDSNIISYDQYLQQTQNTTVQDTYSFAQHNSMIISMFEQMSEQMFEQMSNQVTHWDKANQETKTVNESLTAELERYKERIKTFKERLNTLTKQVKEKESLLQTFAVFKKESKEKERNNIDKEIDLENKIKELDNIVYKLGQSAQIVHMLTKPQVFYDDTYKQALGYHNLFYLKKAQRIKPTLYDAIVISKKHDVIYVVDKEETLVLKEESRSKIIAKQNDPISKEKKINISLINHNELNKLAKDFGKRFVLQKKMFAEQAFWLPLSNPNFDKVVKVRTTPHAITEGSWGFEHTKKVFKEVIPFINSLQASFKDFENGLHSELNEVKTMFNQMEHAVD
ncbi:hypothetical protein Tco_1561949 [Tanacetum coccineum]